MGKKKISFKTCLLIVSGILILDQVLKIYIKLNYSLTFYGEQAIIDWGWFKLLFIENRGMAWGAKLNDFLPFIDDKSAKLILTLFRIVAIAFIFYWLKNIIKENSNKLLAICLSLILAGAIGNVIDSVFYGYIFTESYFEVAKFSPGNGYEDIFYGNVVDMFQFPLFTWTWPDWLPFLAGEKFTFFEPVFNIADSAISIGIFMMIIFNKSFFKN